MSSRHNIAIIGLLTSFNLETARVIADDLELRFLHANELLEYNNTYKISEIIAEQGKEYFLKCEAKVYRELTEYSDSVIGASATALLNIENLKNLKQCSFIILLKANEATTMRRFKLDPNTYLKDEFKIILEKASINYMSLCDIVVDIDKMTPIKAAHKVEDELLLYVNKVAEENK